MAVPDGSQAQAVGAYERALDRVPPVSLVLTGIVSTQIGAALGTTLFDEIGAAGASLTRVFFAALILVILVRPRLARYSRETLGLLAGFGLALGAMNLCFYLAIDHIPLGVAVTLEFVGPLVVAVIGSRRPLDLLWVALAAAGVVVLANPFGASSLDALGVLFAAGAGVGWATYIVLSHRTGARVQGSDGVALAMVVAVLVPLIPGVVQGGAELLKPEHLAIGAVAGLMSSAIPYSLETEALRRIPRHVFSVLMSLEPAVAALAGFVVLGQDLAGRELVAVGLVVVASAGASRAAAQEPEA